MKALEGLTGDNKKKDHWQALEHRYSTLCVFFNTMKPGQDQNHIRQGHQGPHKWFWHWAETSTLQLWIMIHTPLVILTLLTPGFLANVRPSVDANTNLQEAFALFPEDCRLTENHDLQSPNHILISHSQGSSMPSSPSASIHTNNECHRPNPWLPASSSIWSWAAYSILVEPTFPILFLWFFILFSKRQDDKPRSQNNTVLNSNPSTY